MVTKIVNYMNFKQLFNRLISVVVVALSVGLIFFGAAESSTASGLSHPLVAYSIDYGMDQARGEKTIEYYSEFYGESLRELIEQTLRNNEDHPDSKATAKNTFRRESFLNNVLPKQRSTAFSKEDLLKLRSTENPKDRLRK
jgi:hypothetical protein